MAMAVAAAIAAEAATAAEAAIAAEAAMAAPTSPSNLRSSRRNAQPIPARGPLSSANRSAGAGTRTTLCPPSDQSEAARAFKPASREGERRDGQQD